MRENAFTQLHFGLAMAGVHDPSGDCFAGLVFTDVLIYRGRLQLLHPKLDSPAFAVEFEHHRAHGLSGRDRFSRMIQALLIGDVRNVDHALDAVAEVHETPEVSEAGNGPFHHRARSIFL